MHYKLIVKYNFSMNYKLLLNYKFIMYYTCILKYKLSNIYVLTNISGFVFACVCALCIDSYSKPADDIRLRMMGCTTLRLIAIPIILLNWRMEKPFGIVCTSGSKPIRRSISEVVIRRRFHDNQWPPFSQRVAVRHGLLLYILVTKKVASGSNKLTGFTKLCCLIIINGNNLWIISSRN